MTWKCKQYIHGADEVIIKGKEGFDKASNYFNDDLNVFEV